VTEDPATSSFILLPVSDVLVWIVPDNVGNESVIRNISWFLNTFNLLETMHVLGNTTMHTHNFFINKCDQRHVVEASVEGLPETNLVSSLYLVEETVDSCDGLGLVVTSEDDNLLWVSHLQCEQQANDFAGLAASVDIVTHEEISLVLVQDHFLLFGLVLISHFFEHVQKFSELTM
jgi:hypothetical protein